jgi:hypothetical protein
MNTTMTHAVAPRLEHRKYHTATRAAMVVGFWSVAALLVAITHQKMDANWPVACVVLEVSAIVAMAAAYIKFATPEATLDHALLVGTTWLLLGITTELVMRGISGRQWFALLGSPANGGLRCVLLITWVVAPALFASHRE